VGSKWLVAGLFAVSVLGACVASSSIVPVMYGAGEMTPSVGGTSIIGTLTALISGAGGLWTLFRNSTATGFVKDAIGNLTGGNTSGTVLDAAFVTIAATILAKKGAIDPTVLTRLGELRRDIEGEMKKVVP